MAVIAAKLALHGVHSSSCPPSALRAAIVTFCGFLCSDHVGLPLEFDLVLVPLDLSLFLLLSASCSLVISPLLIAVRWWAASLCLFASGAPLGQMEQLRLETLHGCWWIIPHL